MFINKMKTNTTLSRQFQNSNIKVVERDKIDISNTQIHDRSLSCLGTGTSIKNGGVKLVFLTLICVLPLEMQLSRVEGLTPPHLFAFSKPGPGFPMSSVVIWFCVQ